MQTQPAPSSSERSPLFTGILGLAAVLVVAILLDLWTKNLRPLPNASLQPQAMLWVFQFAGLLLAICLVGLGSYLSQPQRRGPLLGAIYVLVGLLVVLYPPVMASGSALSLLAPRLPVYSPASHLSFAGAIVTAMGAFMLAGKAKREP